jgi:hypothetical protein
MIRDYDEVDNFARDSKRALAIQDEFMRSLMKFLCKNEEFYFLPTEIKNKEDPSPIEQHLIQLQKLSVDVLYSSKLTVRPGNAEMKYDWHHPIRICLEIVSNTTTNPPKSGWMKTAKSDRLVYSFIWLKNILDTFVFDFKRLRDWFWEEEPKRTDREWRYHMVPNSRNHTLSRLVPIKDVPRDIIPIQRYLTTSKGDVYPVSPQLNQANIKEFCQLHELPFEVIDYQGDAA